MPGFVDVTNMTSEQVRRMGHADDYDAPDTWKPRQRRASTQPTSVKFSVSDVWAAASAAQRVNGEYVKEEQWMRNATPPYISKRRSRDVMMDFLRGAETLTDEDREAGEDVRKFLQNDLTFRALKGRLTDFDQSVSKVLAVTDVFDTVRNRYELAVIACLPQSHQRAVARQEQQQRLRSAGGGLIGQPGDKISTTIEVVSANYSQQYNIYWIRGVTQADQPVMFSNRASFEPRTNLTIKGTVKAHRDGVTQLNYVKVI